MRIVHDKRVAWIDVASETILADLLCEANAGGIGYAAGDWSR